MSERTCYDNYKMMPNNCEFIKPNFIKVGKLLVNKFPLIFDHFGSVKNSLWRTHHDQDILPHTAL